MLINFTGEVVLTAFWRVNIAFKTSLCMYVVTEFRVRQLYRCSYSCIEGTDVGNVMC